MRGSLPALSIKQPWVTLLLLGVKTIEIRRWATRIRGPVLLHAAKVPDPRPEGWELVTPAMRPLLDLAGGLVGQAILQECRMYRTLDQFSHDRHGHRNPPGWFTPPYLYGFVFSQPTMLTFQPWTGNVRFFHVPATALPTDSRMDLKSGGNHS
jgi:hypothetical protein